MSRPLGLSSFFDSCDSDPMTQMFWMHDFVRCLQLRDSQVAADFAGQEVIDLTMSWNRTCLIITWIEVKTMLTALSKQLASMILKMLD